VNSENCINRVNIFPLRNQAKPETARLPLNNQHKQPIIILSCTIFIQYYHIGCLRNLVKKKLKVAFILLIKAL
jgi:hypothetical protein